MYQGTYLHILCFMHVCTLPDTHVQLVTLNRLVCMHARVSLHAQAHARMYNLASGQFIAVPFYAKGVFARD